MKYQVGFLANNEIFETVVEAQNESEAFCKGRNRAEQVLFSYGVSCVSTETFNHPDSYVKEYEDIDIMELFNDPLLNDIV
jgi:hypothetical protein